MDIEEEYLDRQLLSEEEDEEEEEEQSDLLSSSVCVHAHAHSYLLIFLFDNFFILCLLSHLMTVPTSVEMVDVSLTLSYLSYTDKYTQGSIHNEHPVTKNDLRKLCYLMDHLKTKCQQLFQTSQHIIVDENMVKSKGRSGFILGENQLLGVSNCNVTFRLYFRF